MESATIPQQSETSTALEQLREYARDLNTFGHVLSLLSWDEKTKMPPKGAPDRARQKGLLAGMVHERACSPELLRRIEAVEQHDATHVEARVMRRDYEMSTKLPNAFVREFTEAASVAGHAWQDARPRDDWEGFAPHLERLLTLTRQKADYLGYETEPYDALHDLYEQGMTAARLEPLFAELREPIQRLIEQQPEADLEVLQRHYPLEVQERYVERIVASMGYDMQAGRIDPTAHPFCISIGDGDVRLTTRYDERWLPGSLFSTIHEAGHGIYNQAFSRLGLPAPIASAPGLGMHESQSRMYENIVGRSLPFWQHHYPELQNTFPEALGGVDLDEFYRAINVSERSLIRVEADELTYNLHIALRFELERAMVNGDLEVRDLPEAWADGMQRWVGVVPTNNADGCMQDVHWSMGSFGYFPTYTLGNVYGAQFVEAAKRDLGDLDAQLREGDVSKLLAWFDEHVYQHGRKYTGIEFVERITGGPISSRPLITYLEQKFSR